MSRPLCSIIMSSFQRKHLLQRALHCYEYQDFDNKEIEIICIDDHSTDGTDTLIESWSERTGIAATILTVCPKPGKWVDCGWVLNAGIRASKGEYLLLTHPEVLVGKTSVKECVDQLEKFERVRERDLGPIKYTSGEINLSCPIGLYACCPVYYLTPRDQERIDTVPWRTEGVQALRQIQGFYEETSGNPDYRHSVADEIALGTSNIKTWESWVFGGVSRKTMKALGGMINTNRWGSIDVAFMERRRILGIPNYTCKSLSSICAHENHDGPNDIKTPRSEEAWKDELRHVDLTNSTKLCYPYCDELGWL